MNVLIITCHFIERNGGGCIASRGFVSAIADIFQDCTLIYPDNNGIDLRLFVPSNLQLIPCKDTRHKWRKGLSTYWGQIHRFKKTAKNYLRHNKPDLVIFDRSIVSSGLIDLVKSLGIKIITIHHNVELEFFKDNPLPLMIRYPYLFYMRKVEKKALLESDLNLTVTNWDSKKLISSYLSAGKNCNIKCLGNFEPNSQNNNYLVSEEKKGRAYRFVITGSLSYLQSELSIIEFIDTYLPIMISVIDSFELVIAGRQPSQRLQKACNKFSQIQLIANPNDMMDIISTSDYYLCPINKGGGFKLRIMDGLKMGIPVLTHLVSARGYDSFINSNAMFTYDSPETFKKSLLNMLNCKIKIDSIKILYQETFSYSSGLKRLEEILKENLTNPNYNLI